MTTPSRNILLFGTDQAPPEPLVLRAGPLALRFDGGDLRAVALAHDGGQADEIVRRIYVAVRDHNWGTVPMEMSNCQVTARPDSFQITYDAVHRQGDVDFAWKAEISGSADGTLSFSMDGEARSTFRRNRIGFCILHPIPQCAGVACVAEHSGGTRQAGAFPRLIAPHQPFVDLRGFAHQVRPGLWARLQFAGDIFEMEDQRNWSDASFKAYCTPLSLLYPVQIPKGTRIRQSVRLTLCRDADGTPVAPAATGPGLPEPGEAPPPRRRAVVTLPAAAAESRHRLPAIGLSVASHGQPLSPEEIVRLRRLNLGHLRVDLVLADADRSASALRRATDEARALGVSLEIALALSAGAEAELARLALMLGEVRPPVCRWILLDATSLSAPRQWIGPARAHLAAYAPAAPLGAGTQGEFVAVNRMPPPADRLDFICFSMNPQVHAFDNASLMETLDGQRAILESAAALAAGKPLVVTPVTLRRRFNPDATGAAPVIAPGQLPPQVDLRQPTLFAAAWTAGAIAAMAQPAVAGLTFYETTGWRGVMEQAHGAPLPQRFRSIPGSVFPLYHVLRDVGEFAGGQILATACSDPQAVAHLALSAGDRRRLLLANLMPHGQSVLVQHLPPQVGLRHLDETNAYEAMIAPEEYRRGATRPAQTVDGALAVELRPYALVTLDAAGGLSGD